MRTAVLAVVLACAALAGGCDCGGGDDDDTDADGGVCPIVTGTGTVLVTVDGPAAIPLAILLTAGDGSSESLTEAGGVSLPAGPVTVSTRRTRTSGGLIGTVYVATPSATELCVTPGETTNLLVTLSPDPASGRLWVTDAGGAQVLGLAAADLGGSGAPAPAAVLSGSFASPTGAAMGEDGTLWVIDDGRIEGYASTVLAASGAAQPAIALEGMGGAIDLAFDRNGALWVANLTGNRIDRFDRTALATSGAPSAGATISGPSVVAPRSIAFDVQGNLWLVGDAAEIVRFDAGRLAADVTTAADLVITGVTPEPEPEPLGGGTAIAFDPDGGMWVAHPTGNVVARYSEADRLNPAEITPAAQLTMPAGTSILDLAVDEEGGIWLTGASGQIARLGPNQLRDVGDVTPVALVTPTGLSSASSLAFYPAAAGAPIPY